MKKIILRIFSKRMLFLLCSLLRKLPDNRFGAAKINSKLISLLPREAHTSQIKLGATRMTYQSDAYDDLNLLSRNNLFGWEKESLSWFIEFSKKSATIVDVGAYTGIYSVVAALSNPYSEVYSFEPNPRIIPNLVENLKLNNLGTRVKVQQIALSDTITSAVLNHHEVWSSMNSISTELDNLGDSQLIQVTTLDNYFKKKKVDLIKVDIEGAELKFLRGSSRVLKDDKPVLLMEALDEAQLEFQRIQLKSFGYRDPVPCGTSFADSRNFLWLHSQVNNHFKQMFAV